MNSGLSKFIDDFKKSSANIVSIGRLAFVFLAIYLVMAYAIPSSVTPSAQVIKNSSIAYYLAFIFTVLAFALDGLDGYLARKFKVSSKLGATLDIMADRIAEYAYWILFAVMGWISIVFPLIAIIRGVVVDSIRSVAASYGYTAFGDKSMQDDPVSKFICCSKFVRITYAVAKVGAFMFIILYNIPSLSSSACAILKILAYIFVEVAIILCVLRGLPVVYESKKFFKDFDSEVTSSESANQ